MALQDGKGKIKEGELSKNITDEINSKASQEDLSNLSDDYVAHKAENALKHITESGSNANGNYIRFDDGTQLCWHVKTDDIAIATAFLGGFSSANILWTFPANFISGASVQMTPNSAAFSIISGSNNPTTGANYRYTSITTQTSASRQIFLFAIGRWK